MVIPFLALAITAQSYPTSLDLWEKYVEQQRAQQTQDMANARAAAYEEQQFVESYNELVKALMAFSTKYKDQHVIDVKAVDAIKKAYRRLEKTDQWFRTKEK